MTARQTKSLIESMGRTTYSAVQARERAKDPLVHLLWVSQAQAARFQVRGWTRLEPPREGLVMFLHRERQQAAVGQARRAAPSAAAPAGDSLRSC